jgi:hypothetical protein
MRKYLSIFQSDSDNYWTAEACIKYFITTNYKMSYKILVISCVTA